MEQRGVATFGDADEEGGRNRRRKGRGTSQLEPTGICELCAHYRMTAATAAGAEHHTAGGHGRFFLFEWMGVVVTDQN